MPNDSKDVGKLGTVTYFGSPSNRYIDLALRVFHANYFQEKTK